MPDAIRGIRAHEAAELLETFTKYFRDKWGLAENEAMQKALIIVFRKGGHSAEQATQDSYAVAALTK